MTNTTIVQYHIWNPSSHNCNCDTLPASVTHTTNPKLVAEMWVKCLFLALLTQCLALQQDCTQVGRKEKNLTIQLQVSQSSEFDFSGYIPAVEVALRFINTNSCVLPDYHISSTDIVDPRVSKGTSLH